MSSINQKFARYALTTVLAFCEFELKPQSCEKPKSNWKKSLGQRDQINLLFEGDLEQTNEFVMQFNR